MLTAGGLEQRASRSLARVVDGERQEEQAGRMMMDSGTVTVLHRS